MTYRVREPLQVIPGQSEPLSFAEITPGSIIAVTGEVQESWRVEVLYNGRIFVAFLQDIEARADMIEDETIR